MATLTPLSQTNRACLELEPAQALDVLEYLVATLTPLSQTNRACLELEPAQALDVLEYLVATFPDDQDIHSLLGNLACMYNSVAFAAGNEHIRQEMLQKAEENFLKSKACGGVNVTAGQTNYSMLLLHLHRYKEATTMLQWLP